MAIRGTILITHQPNGQLEVVAENLGESPGELTHNCFNSLQEAQTSKVHDDNGRYGHGDAVPQGTDARPGEARRSFPINGQYGGHSKLAVGNWFRVGFRYRAFKPVQIPPRGVTIIVPYEDMIPQGQQYGGNYGWNPEKVDRSKRAGMAGVYAKLNSGEKHMAMGQVRIVPVPDPRKPNELKGWEVWFDNMMNYPLQDGQTNGFSGTVVLTNKAGEGKKNAGLGLESMGCPAGGYSAKQFILFNGDYGEKEFGIRAQPGTKMRLGIRGLSAFETTLPSLDEGERHIGLQEFKETKGDLNSAWFETKEILGKLGEKKGHVDFFKDGQRINDQLPDTIYFGEEAFIKAEFKDPPRVTIDWLEPSDRLPKGGWEVTMESPLPEEDKLGRVGFIGALKVMGAGGALAGDEAALPPRQFTPELRKYQWTIPVGAKIAGHVAKAGLELAIDTGPLAWRGRIALPAKGESVDTAQNQKTLEKVWVLRETDYHRANIYPPELYRGQAGVKKAPVPAPELVVRGVGDGEETPGGGWIIEMKSTFPKKDDDGAIGYVGTLKLGRSGKDAGTLPPRKFTAPDQTNTWFLAKGTKIGDHVAEAGAELVAGARGTGWYVALPLPKEGDEVGVEDLADRWTFRADQFDRAFLNPAQVAKTKLGPDEPKPPPGKAKNDGQQAA